jgi:hypothetical protein
MPPQPHSRTRRAFERTLDRRFGARDLRHFLREVARVRIFVLYLAVAIPARIYGWVDPNGVWAVLLTRPAGYVTGWMFAHIFLQQGYDYTSVKLCYEGALDRRRRWQDRMIHAVLFAGLMLLRGLFYAFAGLAGASAWPV